MTREEVEEQIRSFKQQGQDAGAVLVRRTYFQCASLLAAALEKSESRDASEPGQKTARIPVKDVLAWKGDYMSEPREIAEMGPGLWMAVEIAYDYVAGYATVTAYPVTP